MPLDSRRRRLYENCQDEGRRDEREMRASDSLSRPRKNLQFAAKIVSNARQTKATLLRRFCRFFVDRRKMRRNYALHLAIMNADYNVAVALN